MGWIITKKKGRPGKAPERRKESSEWENSRDCYRQTSAETLAPKRKAPPERGFGDKESLLSVWSNGRNVRRLKALWTLDYVETNSLSLRQRPETFDLDLTEVDEEIFPLRLLNESVALFGTKPLDSPLSQTYNLHVFGATRFPAHPILKHAARDLLDTRRHNSGTKGLGQGISARIVEVLPVAYQLSISRRACASR